MEEKELTILMPCLNEEKTLEICIKKAKKFLENNSINGEVIVADNGSTDNSRNIAEKNGARIVDIPKRGYGNALRYGCLEARGKYTIIGDADDSYNFLELQPILDKLKEGNDFVIGNRYKGKMEKGAMKFTHRYIGTPIISFIARKKYKVKIGDFNCGLRGYETAKNNNLGCESEGMEYASEQIIKAKQQGLKIAEIPINFYRDGRNSSSHLRTIRDGIRHFKLIFKH